jgi:hypothetical protein
MKWLTAGTFDIENQCLRAPDERVSGLAISGAGKYCRVIIASFLTTETL